MAVLTTFFAKDPKFNNPAQCSEFTAAMLEKNQFLFAENSSSNSKVHYYLSVFVLN